MNLYQPTDLFRPYLLAGERILWTGQPKQGIALSGKDFFLIPFSLLWGGFAIFWNAMVWMIPDDSGHIDWFFQLWGLPFLVVGIYIMIGRLFHDAAIRRKLHYAVTDQRILVLRASRSPKFTSFDLHRLPKLELSERHDGTGTIQFESTSWFSSRLNGFDIWVPSLNASSQFFRIDNPRKVYELIRNQSHS